MTTLLRGENASETRTVQVTRLMAATALAVCLAGLTAARLTANQSCRTYATTYRTVTRSSAFTSTVNGTCRFDGSANQTTCTNNYADTMGGSSTSTAVTSYLSRADVVDEIAVVPPLRRSTGTATASRGSNGSGSATLVNTYDGQRRLAREVGTGYTTTYTAWDTAGRPTAGTSTNSGQTLQLTMAYDNAARTQVMTTTGRGFSQTCTSTFDINGTNVSNVCGAGGSAVTATTTVETTAQVCR